MQQTVGFDIIGDLCLSPNDNFNWENKATSLYCIVAGNISDSVRTVKQTLLHLSKYYQCVFYVPGELEYVDTNSLIYRLNELIEFCKLLPNVCLLHQHVAMIDGVAVVGVNGWNNAGDYSLPEYMMRLVAREQEVYYLDKAIEKLQRHLDIKKIIIVSNAVPNPQLYFKEEPEHISQQSSLDETLNADTEKKVSHWVFGTYKKPVNTMIDGVTYVNNPKNNTSTYWAKRVEVSVGV